MNQKGHCRGQKKEKNIYSEEVKKSFGTNGTKCPSALEPRGLQGVPKLFGVF